MVMMWMEFECETSLLAKTPETCQHFFDFFQNCHLIVTFQVVAKLSNGGLQRKTRTLKNADCEVDFFFMDGFGLRF